jgi:SAM-dependent methyltransferase
VSGSNAYSRRWFDTFLGRIDPAIVEREVAFLRRHLPSPDARVLDLCCGPGRHAKPLSDAGYHVIGIDLDMPSLGTARATAPRAVFVRADMRRIPLGDKSVGAVICMWQSFGHFDARENGSVLAEMARVARTDGVVILDLYQREFYARNEGERDIVRDGARIHERRVMTDERLRVRLAYEPGGFAEEFEWQLYTPAEIAALAAPAGLRMLGSFADFDDAIASSRERARMQIVLRKTG